MLFIIWMNLLLTTTNWLFTSSDQVSFNADIQFNLICIAPNNMHYLKAPYIEGQSLKVIEKPQSSQIEKHRPHLPQPVEKWLRGMRELGIGILMR